jgi:hypothetical protein
MRISSCFLNIVSNQQSSCQERGSPEGSIATGGSEMGFEATSRTDEVDGKSGS